MFDVVFDWVSFAGATGTGTPGEAEGLAITRHAIVDEATDNPVAIIRGGVIRFNADGAGLSRRGWEALQLVREAAEVLDAPARPALI